VVGAKAPLGQLPTRWRVVTLIAMGNLFGIDLYMPEPWPAAANQLFRQAVPRRPSLAARSRRVTRGGSAAKRSSADYLRLAQALLTPPDWIAAAGLPDRTRQRVRARLIDASLAQPAAALGSHERGRGRSPPIRCESPAAGGRFLRECRKAAVLRSLLVRIQRLTSSATVRSIHG
jgi:hypothetical protein